MITVVCVVFATLCVVLAWAACALESITGSHTMDLPHPDNYVYLPWLDDETR